ncbi:hypothetical protein SAY87_008985 [Trapa incisa]|uniref:Uncharacterized protein n=1 Tax=Trapa incisa TaxID=236973 RepID=A0AAN7K100_9MYRT|nr:hypothetical protein SAY87_008985 [Trapa incisa]
MSERHSNKRKLLLSSGAIDMGCGCRKFAKLFSFLQTKPKFTTSPSSSSPSASVSASSSSVYRHGFSGEKSNYSLRYLLDAERAFKSPVKPVKGFGRIDDEGIALSILIRASSRYSMAPTCPRLKHIFIRARDDRWRLPGVISTRAALKSVVWDGTVRPEDAAFLN